MAKIKTSELSGTALDWVVASLEQPDLTRASLNYQIKYYNKLMLKSSPDNLSKYSPSTHWAQGGLIIEREKIRISFVNMPEACPDFDNPNWEQRFYGKTYLIAAMRCYVASKLGDGVEVPDELLNN